MHICDKCQKYGTCYSMKGNIKKDQKKRAEVEAHGCPNYRELTLERMFLHGHNKKEKGKAHG